MAIGKNKKLGKKKKTGGKKAVDPFLRKDWFDLKAPNCFPITKVGKTIATKTTGQKTSKESLMQRVVEVSLGELKPNASDDAFRKFRLRIEDVQGSQCLMQFNGMDLTTDKIRSLVKKNHTLIEAYADVKTTDGYALRVFAIGFTKNVQRQQRVTSYAQSGQVRMIRKRMIKVIEKEVSSSDLHQLVQKLLPDSIGTEIEKATKGVYPLHHVYVRKVKVLRTPKTDLARLMEMHGGAEALKSADAPVSVAVDRPAEADI